MTWDAGTIAKFPRLTDNSENAVTVRALACKAYENHYQFIGTWDDLNPQVRAQWCVITAAILAAKNERKA